MAYEHGDFTSITNSTKIDRVATSPTVVNGVITQVLSCAWTDREDYTPDVNSEHPTYDSYTLQSASHERTPGDLCKITLVYTTNFDQLPDATVVEQSSQEQVAIQEHPDFADWSSEWDSEKSEFLPSSDKYGITSYIKGSTTVTITEYYNSKPSSKREDIGTLESPGGDYGGSEHWLIIGSTRQQQGKFWTRQTCYLWSAKEWNADIYS